MNCKQCGTTVDVCRCFNGFRAPFNWMKLIIGTMFFLAGAAIFAMGTVANAGTIPNYPNLVAQAPGNDNAQTVSALVGHPVELVGKWDDIEGPPITWDAQGLARDLTLNITDQGLAFFFASGYLMGTVEGEGYDYLAVKSGPNFFVFEREDFFTPWHTDCHFVSHISLYRGMPEPSSGFLALFGLTALMFRRRVECPREPPVHTPPPPT